LIGVLSKNNRCFNFFSQYMNVTSKILALCLLLNFFPLIASAHQPRLITWNEIQVSAPEISKAYYTELSGNPHTYNIISTWAFRLYVNILVPNQKSQTTDFTVTISKEWTIMPLAVLEGKAFNWKPFFEPFWHDWYSMWPEYSKIVEPGNYTITVTNPDLKGKYSLAVGEKEVFDLTETVNAVTLIPQIKKEFFQKYPIDFILSPFGAGFVIILYLLSFFFGFLYRFLLKSLARWTIRGASKNISTPDRILRAFLGLSLLIRAIMTSWSPLLIFFSGFCFFEAIWSRCGFYAALGKSSCPL